MFFGLLDAKPCRTIVKSPQQVSFGPEACEIGPKVEIWTCPDLPRPVSKACFSFLFFSEITPLRFSLANLSFRMKSNLLWNKFMIF